MAVPLSIRFDTNVLDRLRRKARALPGATASGLVQRLVDEGLRMADHPGIIFKDGPAGRRAALMMGPDVWEVVTVTRETNQRGDKAVNAVAEAMGTPAFQVEIALRYYASYPDEIDAELVMREETSRTAEEEWHARQRLLA